MTTVHDPWHRSPMLKIFLNWKTSSDTEIETAKNWIATTLNIERSTFPKVLARVGWRSDKPGPRGKSAEVLLADSDCHVFRQIEVFEGDVIGPDGAAPGPGSDSE